MTDVEKFYYAVAAKFGSDRKWGELSRDEQVQFVHGINLILFVFR
jgi:hypothetical protein